MKRKHSTHVAAEADGDGGPRALPSKKRARAETKPTHGEKSEEEESVQVSEELIDVQDFLLRDCKASGFKLVDQAKTRAAELRRELEAGKKTLLDALEAEKENLHSDKDGNAIPRAFTIAVRCVTGPYRGRKFAMEIDTKRHSSCFIGRSTGRKFRSPRGLSMPKDSELSTSHAELKMETNGKVFFIDLDSTNGSFIDDQSVEAHEPHELRVGKPVKVEVGGGELELTLKKKS